MIVSEFIRHYEGLLFRVFDFWETIVVKRSPNNSMSSSTRVRSLTDPSRSLIVCFSSCLSFSILFWS